MRRYGRAWLGAVAAALACGPIQADPGPAAPVNSCPDHPCSAYAQSGAVPVCTGGECRITTDFPDGLVAVISLPQDSPYAPERTFVLPYPPDRNAPPDAPSDACPAQGCAWLPGVGDITESFSALPSNARDVGWNLGNANTTWLPAQATYRLLWPPKDVAQVEASSLGLPVDGIPSDLVAASAPPGLLPPGPNGGPSMEFREVNLPPGDYELTLMPVPPLDRAFPPDVERVTVVSGSLPQANIALQLDHTTGTLDPSGASCPTFDITRDDGLDGWSAYLRDKITLRRISNLPSLSGITSTGVRLCTDHHPPVLPPATVPDALTNAQLIVVPPAGQAVPTYVLSPQAGVLQRTEAYPSLPPPLTVSGSVVAGDGSPLDAEVEFEATGIYAILMSGTVLNTENFVYTARAHAQIDATGASTYSIALPQGQYRVSIRPGDTTAAVTIVPRPLLVDAMHPQNVGVFAANGSQVVQGAAAVADGRPLASAVVELVPAGCAVPPDSPACMPRAAQTTTDEKGSFAFGIGSTPGVDQGSYVLRVEPAPGTRLPWVWTSLVVGPTPVVEPLVSVPAPAYAGLRLYSPPQATAVVNAIVRMFALQPTGPAIEIGRAITDANGDYDMYLAPPPVAQ